MKDNSKSIGIAAALTIALIIILVVTLSSCEKQSYKVRNYTYPGDLENPTGIPQLGAGIHVYPGESDEDLIKRIREFFGKLLVWKNINDLIPQNFMKNSKYNKTGKAGIFSGSLELVKEGNLKIKQENLFDDIFIKEIK